MNAKLSARTAEVVTKSVIDIDLIRRYDLTGPRYTSYPTAVQFTESFSEADYRDAASDSNNLLIPRALSLYYHIPFCSTLCFYCACNKVVTRNRDKAVEYLRWLYREIERQGALFDRDRPVVQLHLGGGTPTFLTSDQIESLLEFTGRHFSLSKNDERDYSIEVDPRTVDARTVWRLRHVGFNRLSLGVQDFDPRVQKAVHRIQPEKVTLEVMRAARDAGFRSLNVDLIYGLPFQTVASFERTLDRILATGPDRLSIFNYAHLPHRFSPQQRIQEADLPSAEEKLRILAHTVDRLVGAGYVYIGMDHFAKPDDVLSRARETRTLYRNFQGYATHADCDLVGMGVSAISKVDLCYSQNSKDLDDYYERIEREGLAVERGVRLGRADCLRRDVIDSLMCYGELDIRDTERKYDIRFAQLFAEELERLGEMERDGLLTVSPERIRLSPTGRFLVRNVCMVFDEYLPQEGAVESYSRVI